MRKLPALLCAVCAAAALALAVAGPLPEARPETLQDSQAQLPPEVQERLSELLQDEQTLEQVTRDKRTLGIIRQLFPGLGQTELNPEENQLSGAESQVNEVRAQYTDKDGYNYDQDAAATGDNAVPDPANGEAASDDEDADRNKRLINFSLGASGGAGGGSGNFLFDIIRLVSGSGNTETSSDHVVGGAVEKEDGYGAGIPGPITRLFVIANRGIANLVQDLILRIAQTSERLVNFKARLITSII